MTMNTALFNTVVAEAMDEIKGVWAREDEMDRMDDFYAYELYADAYQDYCDDDYDDVNIDYACLGATQQWLEDHIAEYGTEEYYDQLGFYSDYYKDAYGIRPHAYMNALYEMYAESVYQGA